ncbi:hypothetical protein QBC38DRAFT_546479 [Podospora fimiseda]|uniref:LITAF domain-containing protein n=1 Tax=Podospora fimiseda TaxID=252190 RepID=A0AAN7BLM2_9PEZI|nr:hypothetical protein QBC38DRAFT_546479 [Podospora fimiseda]
MAVPACRSVDSLAITPVEVDTQPKLEMKATQVVTAQPSKEPKPSAAEKSPDDVVAFEDLRAVSQYILCPYCETRQKTTVKHKVTDHTCKASLICCVVGGVVGSIIPFLCLWYSDVNHYCKSCGNLVARKPEGGVMAAVPPKQMAENKPTEPVRGVSRNNLVKKPSKKA